MSIYKIRHATRRDVESESHLIEAALREEGENLISHFPTLYPHLLDNPRQLSICEFEGQIVGISHAGLGARYSYVNKENKEVNIRNVWGFGVLYVVPSHRGKHLTIPLRYILVKDMVASRPRDQYIYAMPTKEANEKILEEWGIEKIGVETIESLQRRRGIKQLNTFRAHMNIVLKKLEAKLGGVTVPYEIVD